METITVNGKRYDALCGNCGARRVLCSGIGLLACNCISAHWIHYRLGMNSTKKQITLTHWCEAYPEEAAMHIGDLRDILKKLIELDDGDAAYWWDDNRAELLDQARQIMHE